MSSERYLKVVAIIQARKTSSRLPNKISLRLGEKTLLEHLIYAVEQSEFIDEIVVASPHHIELPDGIISFIGDENDVLKRYYDAANHHKADIIVRLTSDCPLMESEVIDTAVKFYVNHIYLGYTCFAPIDGMDVEVFSKEMLERAYLNATEPYDREHVTPYIRRVTKLSVDTEEDYNRVKVFYEKKGVQ